MEFITPEEKSQLERRLAELKGKRSEISERIATARAQGDLKENADYHAAREEQGLNEAEIRRLEERLNAASVVDQDETPDDIVFVGATVRLRDLQDGEEETYRLVGEPSGDLDSEIIEVTAESPVGEALVKARVGEVVRVNAPRGVKRFEVVAIE